MNDVERQMWKGGDTPTSFPHVCPYRLDGTNMQSCVELSGGNIHQNMGGCCGTSRGTVYFASCNSLGRRCIACLQMGRRGIKANAVTDVATGMCDEHVKNKLSVSAEAKRTHINSVIGASRQLRDLRVSLERKLDTPQPSVLQINLPLESVIKKTPDEPVIFEKKRRIPAEKFAALVEAATELRREKFNAQSEGSKLKVQELDFQLEVNELIACAAAKLNMSCTGLKTHFYRSLPEETKTRLLYGNVGRKRTRSEIKFDILMQVRQQFREKGGALPRKKELAEAAAKPLGMKLDSARTYIYDRLTPEEVEALQLRGQFLSRSEQIAILRKVRMEMKQKGSCPPNQTELAIAAAPLLRQKVSSVRTLIGQLSEETKKELEFLSSPEVFIRKNSVLIREGFIGAIAILKLRGDQIIAENIRRVLQLKRSIFELYIDNNPDMVALLDSEESS